MAGFIGNGMAGAGYGIQQELMKRARQGAANQTGTGGGMGDMSMGAPSPKFPIDEGQDPNAMVRMSGNVGGGGIEKLLAMARGRGTVGPMGAPEMGGVQGMPSDNDGDLQALMQMIKARGRSRLY